MSVTYLFPAIRRSNMRGTLFIMVFLFVPSTIFAAIDNNTTNASADIVIGQPDFTSSISGRSANTFSNPTFVYTDGTKLLFSDEANNRVLVFNSIPTANNASADVVIGQVDFTSSTSATSQTIFSAPSGVWSDGSKLYIANVGSNRGLIYNSIPLTNGVAADFVVGQAGFESSSWGASPLNTKAPRGIFSDGNRLILTNDMAHSVKIFNSIPQSNNPDDDITISTISGGLSLNRPRFAMSDGNHFFIVDLGRNRVLIWNKAYPLDANDPPDVVVGQLNLNSGSANQGGSVGANTLSSPTGLYSDGTRLFISDRGNNRVLIYNSIPTSNNASADIVIGQPDFISNSSNNGGKGANTFNSPHQAVSDSKRLFVGDQGNSRVLIYNFLNAPTNFTSPSQTENSITLSVDSFATALGTAKYYFSRSDGLNSGWITNPTWTDTGLSGDTGYTYTIKYGTGDGIESETVSLPVRTVAPPHGGGRGSRSPGRGGIAPVIDAATKTVLPDQADSVSPLYSPTNQVPPAPTGIISPLRDRLAARIEKRITQYPRLRTTLLRMLQRLDQRLSSRRR